MFNHRRKGVESEKKSKKKKGEGKRPEKKGRDGFVKLCTGVENAPYVLIGLILNLVFQGSIAWQEHICLQRFYNWLTD